MSWAMSTSSLIEPKIVSIILLSGLREIALIVPLLIRAKATRVASSSVQVVIAAATAEIRIAILRMRQKIIQAQTRKREFIRI